MNTRNASRDVLRVCKFNVCRGPAYRLTMWDTGRMGEYGKSVLGYELVEYADVRVALGDAGATRVIRQRTVLFTGEDFSPGAGTVIDSDDCVRSLMGFLTLTPGDTDSDYFARYTEEQLAFCAVWSGELANVVEARFGVES